MSAQLCLSPLLSFPSSCWKAPAVNITLDFSRFVAVIVSRCQGFFSQQDVSGRVRFCPSTPFLLFLVTYFLSVQLNPVGSAGCQKQYTGRTGGGMECSLLRTQTPSNNASFSLAVEESEWETGQGTGSPREDRVQSWSRVRGSACVCFLFEASDLASTWWLHWLAHKTKEPGVMLLARLHRSVTSPADSDCARHSGTCWDVLLGTEVALSPSSRDRKQCVLGACVFIFLVLKTKEYTHGTKGHTVKSLPPTPAPQPPTSPWNQPLLPVFLTAFALAMSPWE